jgi:hypothetical protein
MPAPFRYLLLGDFTLLAFCSAPKSSTIWEASPGGKPLQSTVAGFPWNLFLHGDISVINGYRPPPQQIES